MMKASAGGRGLGSPIAEHAEQCLHGQPRRRSQVPKPQKLWLLGSVGTRTRPISLAPVAWLSRRDTGEGLR
jgi:hypothetical protein